MYKYKGEGVDNQFNGVGVSFYLNRDILDACRKVHFI